MEYVKLFNGWYMEFVDMITIFAIMVILIIGTAIAVHFIWKKHYDKKMLIKFETMINDLTTKTKETDKIK